MDKKNQLDVTFCILYFSSNSCSTGFGQPCAHHQELTTAWCCSLVLVCVVSTYYHKKWHLVGFYYPHCMKYISYLPAYEDGTECSETSQYKIQTPGNYPDESIQHSEHGESLKSRIFYLLFVLCTLTILLVNWIIIVI